MRTQYLRNFGLLILSTLLFTGCKNGEADEAIGFFLGFIVFLCGTIVTGIPAIILSAISISTKNVSVPVIAIVLTALYGIFFFIEVSIFSDVPGGMKDTMFLFPLITLAIIGMCITFIVMGFKKRKNGFSSNADSEIDLLDNIINSEEDKDLL